MTRHVRRVERVYTSVWSRAVRQTRHSQNAWARQVYAVQLLVYDRIERYITGG